MFHNNLNGLGIPAHIDRLLMKERQHLATDIPRSAFVSQWEILRPVQQDRFRQLSESRHGMQRSARHTRESTRPPPRQPKISSVGVGLALGQLSLPDLDGCTWTNSNVLPLKCGKCK